MKLYNEKRQDLEEQQLHLNVGLQKIRETVEQVEELQASLSVKKNELEQKNALANQKLKQMVHDQQEAEKRKVTSQEIQEALVVRRSLPSSLSFSLSPSLFSSLFLPHTHMIFFVFSIETNKRNC